MTLSTLVSLLDMFSLLLSSGLLALAHASTVAHVSPEHAYLLTPSFTGGEVDSINTWTATTNTTDSALNSALRAASNASFISYDDQFLAIVGTNSSFNLVDQRPGDWAAEGGAWAWDRDEVWFTSGVGAQNATAISVLHLRNNSISTPVFSGDPLPNPNGAYYFNRTVYFTTAGNATHAGGIVSIDPATNVVTTLLNSYYGQRFNYPDDLAWATVDGRSYLFFTDLGAPAVTASFEALADNPAPQIQNAVWRFDPLRKSLRAVISRADCAIPNGVRVNADATKLYVTDSSYSGFSGTANSSFGSGAVYEFALNDHALPVQKSLFALTRQGLADGIKLDDAGNVWVAAYDGYSVYAPDGKLLGVINANPLLLPGAGFPTQNFALAGDVLVVFAQTRLWTYKLAKQVVSPGNLS